MVGVRASGCLARSTYITPPVPRLEDTARILFGDPPHRRPELPADHQAVIGLCPVLRRHLYLGDGEVLRTLSQRVFHQHSVTPLRPGV